MAYFEHGRIAYVHTRTSKCL